MKIRGIPDITIIVRHYRTCPHRGDTAFRDCNCRKSLRWSDGKKQHWLATKSRTWAEAELARENLIKRYYEPAPLAWYDEITERLDRLTELVEDLRGRIAR